MFHQIYGWLDLIASSTSKRIQPPKKPMLTRPDVNAKNGSCLYELGLLSSHRCIPKREVDRKWGVPIKHKDKDWFYMKNNET